MKTVKCQSCNGTGYCGPVVAPDTPSILRPIGCWPCPLCQGKGEYETIELTDEMMKSFRETCMWDGLSDYQKSQPMGLSCPCPKCSPSC